jgi:hypothetical protein
MPRPTIVEAPAYVNATKAIEYAKKIVNEYRSGSITTAALAHTMNHENDKSGTFLRKVSDLKRYGILEGRGNALYATDLAKRISASTSEEEKDAALKEMVFNIPIFKQLYDAFLSNRSPSDNEVLSQLLNITKKDRADLQSISAEIRKFYIDAVQYINMKSASVQVQTQRPEQQQPVGFDATPIQTSDKSKEVLTFTADGISLKIVNDEMHLERAKNFIKLYLPEEDKKKKAT